MTRLAPSPAFVVDLGRLRHNLAILDDVQKRSGAKILMAQKAFSMWSVYPIIRETLHGVCASSPWEARLGREEFGGEVHSHAAAFKESDIRELVEISDHIVFNSFAQLEREFTAHGESVDELEFSSDGRWLATASLDNSIKIWNARTWEPAARRNLTAELGRWETSGPTGR